MKYAPVNENTPDCWNVIDSLAFPSTPGTHFVKEFPK